MAQVVAYEIEIQTDGTWRTLQSYDPSELGEAKSEVQRLQRNPPGSGLKLVEETLGEDGMFKRRTLMFKRFDEGTPPPAALRAPASSRDPKGGASVRARAAPVRPAKAGKTAGRPQRMGFGGSLADLLSFLFVPLRSRRSAGDGDIAKEDIARIAPPEITGPTRKRGQVPIFEDEQELSLDEVIVADATYRQFRAFFEALREGGALEAAKRDLEFARKISLFAIGVLFSIEQDINIFSDRGRSIVAQVLKFFIESTDAIGHFVETMERYLTDKEAPASIRVGSRCFRLYQSADIDGMKQAFAEAFGLAETLEAGLGGKVKVGILFTDIVDSTRLTSEIGDAAAQSVIDHHEKLVLDMCRRFGGRKVKHLGDGLMLSFANKERMVACAAALIDSMKGLANRPDAPEYKIRCGGHFGEAIQKEEDFFGTTVQLAARISARAGANEACFSTQLFDRDLPTYAQFEDRGAVELKGFSQKVMLAVYG
ncbi:adenylate/guanylate cyclase domain-containing protein [Thalassobaculum sp. OXR-137]|uniref:adenylate/guanylate cyclase domain-containing protein n=1 Tax=Thalassobaculum sp. OXR-137 TaxID=3100173 RepID=UPI002AC9D409|nr:adenylate/guanylate cyclase domain-containing protein [Thalassobaculum sp. OXR-137]WPZ34753.1 adenylate/guanylate cyclase domain-containing protein [Thalassobaculum sp. OXR-137]